MTEKLNETAANFLSHIQSLQTYMKSKVSISNSGADTTLVTVNISNEAPVNVNGGNVVFNGVGLRFIDNKTNERIINYSLPIIKKSRTSDQDSLRRLYDQGLWSNGGGAFPSVTSGESTSGEILFPSESVTFEVPFQNSDLPHLEVKVEGSISRRHLLHFWQPIMELEELRKPLIVSAFLEVDKVELFAPFISIANEIPSVSPQTSFADINTIKSLVEKIRTQLTSVLGELKKANNSPPGRELREYVENIFRYIKSVGIASETAQKVLSSGDTEKIKTAVDEMKKAILATDELKQKRAKLIAKFDITSLGQNPSVRKIE